MTQMVARSVHRSVRFPVLRGLALLALCALLPACAEVNLAAQTAKIATGGSTSVGGTPPGTRYKIGKPYRIAGQRYVPREDYDYSEVGIASWYGPNFHGRQTANGEIFDRRAMTAAHRTLPMPSMVEVTNLGNGRTVVVRINDRGPFAKNRIIDVSEKVSELLGFKRQGTARVRVRVLAGESRAIKAMLTGQPVEGVGLPSDRFLQVATFRDRGNADRLVSHVTNRYGRSDVSIVLYPSGSDTFHRVVVGPEATQGSLSTLRAALVRDGFSDAKVIAGDRAMATGG